MRMIEISTDVFAAIWAARENDESDENVILSRILGVSYRDDTILPTGSASAVGHFDRRNDVRFSEGFIIYREYKGKTYKAVATGGVWKRPDTGVSFTSLNKLNGSIVPGQENVWSTWKYRTEDGRENSIDALRK